MIKSALLSTALLALALAGCSKDDSKVAPLPDPGTPAAKAANATPPAAHAPTAAVPPNTPAHNGGAPGKVLETMNSGGYTYARLQAAGEERWVAGPETTLAVGDEILVGPGSAMPNFHSNTLDRTFDTIYFVSSLTVAGAPAPAGGAAHPTPAAPTAPVKVTKLKPVKGGTSIADVFAGKDKLSGKDVAVRGTVVKYNSGIMGKNWIHLQDGSGDAASKTNDLTVTTDGTAKVGDVVVVRGKLATNKDFGGGYSYDVIVEDAAVTAE